MNISLKCNCFHNIRKNLYDIDPFIFEFGSLLHRFFDMMDVLVIHSAFSASLFGLFDSLVPLIIQARKDWKAELVEID